MIKYKKNDIYNVVVSGNIPEDKLHKEIESLDKAGNEFRKKGIPSAIIKTEKFFRNKNHISFLLARRSLDGETYIRTDIGIGITEKQIRPLNEKKPIEGIIYKEY